MVLAKDETGALSPQQGLVQLHFYDQRAGMEVASFGSDKQGLGIAKRRKCSLIGQEMLLGLAQLAHNLIIWLRPRQTSFNLCHQKPHSPSNTLLFVSKEEANNHADWYSNSKVFQNFSAEI